MEHSSRGRHSVDKDSQLNYFPAEGKKRKSASKKAGKGRRRKPPKPTKTILIKALVAGRYASRGISLRAIQGGRVDLNGMVVHSPNRVVHLSSDEISVDGVPLQPDGKGQVTIIMNKPPGLSGSREMGRPSIYSFVNRRRGWYTPAGVLPKSCEGLIVLSNDELQSDPDNASFARLTSDFLVKVSHSDASTIIDGVTSSLVELVGGETSSVNATVSGQNVRSAWIQFTQARYSLHDIARALKANKCEVLRWVRTRIGPFTTEALKPGEWRRLAQHELDAVEGIVSSGIDDRTSVDDVWTAIAEAFNGQ